MRKVFILLFISLALLSCQKEENNRKTEYQVLTSKDASKPFSCLGEKRIITITIIKKTLIDDVLSSEVPIIPRDVSVEFDKTLFSDIETKVEGDQVVLNITSNINKEDKILNISADTNKEKFSQMANIDVNYKIIRNSKELTEEESIVTGDILQMESGQEYKFIVKGDVNSDGVANIKDVIVLRKYLLMKNNLNEVEQLAADTDLDGKTIGIKDLVRMRIIVITQGVM